MTSPHDQSGNSSSDAVLGRISHPLRPLTDYNSRQALSERVAIPRAANTNQVASSSRVGRACESCRGKRAKCSGHRPTCLRCQQDGVRCIYGENKREKSKKDIDDLTTRVRAYETVLQQIHSRLDTQSAALVDRMFSELSDSSTSRLTTFGASNDRDMSKSPLSATNFNEEDFNHDEEIRATGFLGESSEIAWLYGLKRDLGEGARMSSFSDDSNHPSPLPSDNSVGDSEILFQDLVDTSQVPPQATAKQLVDSYFQVAHTSFPFIGKVYFLRQCESFYSNPMVRPGKRWMAVLNLVFAIASRHSWLMGGSSGGSHHEHTVYFSRAWLLSMHNANLLEHPDLQQVQVEGLVSLYLLSVGEVDRAWRICCLAVRSAMDMGIHRQIENDDIPPISKEIRYRLWWALSLLDIVLREMTGRPPNISRAFCTTPLPVPYGEEDFGNEFVMQLLADNNSRTSLAAFLLSVEDKIESEASPSDRKLPIHMASKIRKDGKTTISAADGIPPNGSLYLLYAVDLATVTRNAVDTLYCSDAARRSWLEIQSAITQFNRATDLWLSCLPVIYDFTAAQPDQPFLRQRTSLALRFYSTKIIVSRPCLRRVTSKHLKETPTDPICDSMAATCVQMAGHMLDVLPDEFDASWLYGCSPWWCVAHYVVQSATVLLTKLINQPRPKTDEVASIEKLKKAILWLGEMSRRDPYSLRAWSVFRDITSGHGSKLGMDVDGPLASASDSV